MPSFLQLEPIDFDDVAETLFMGGTDIIDVSRTEFQTVSGDITIRFFGRNLTYGEDGTLTSGRLEEYRVYQGDIAIETQLIIASSNFTLLSFQELNQAFALAAAGDDAGAVDLVTTSWEREFFSHSSYAAGYLRGYSGGDSLFSSDFVDTVEGFSGDDTIILGAGDDEGYGGKGDDRLDGDEGNDQVFGGTGRDGGFAGGGDDVFQGGDGNDWHYGGTGLDYLVGGNGNDTLNGSAGADTLEGNAGEDILSGDSSDDILLGGDGNDQLFGRTDSDFLYGGAGLDTLFSGQGSDFMEGGDDADTFFAAQVAIGFDVITDFEDNIDTIRFLGFDFADAAAVLALATEVGNDVEFNLGLDRGLTVLNTTIAALADDLIV